MSSQSRGSAEAAAAEGFRRGCRDQGAEGAEVEEVEEVRQGRSAGGVEGPGEHRMTGEEVAEAVQAVRATQEVVAAGARWTRAEVVGVERLRTATGVAPVLS